MQLDLLLFVLVSSTVLGLSIATNTTTTAAKFTNRTRPVYDENLSDKEILDDLLLRRAYDKRIIPPKHGPLTINVSVLLLSLASPDESSLKYEVEFLMRQTWTDPRLAYEAGSHTFLNGLHHYESIWLPDTYFIKHGDFKEPLMPVHIALRVYQNGTILYIMRRHLILSCQGNLNIFPFDDPICRFSMESISYGRDQMVYQWNNDEGKLRKTPSLAALNAYLIHNQTGECPERFSWRGNLSCVMVELTFTRDKAFYFTTVFIPGIILVTSSFITFWLEWNAVPARVLIGVTTMLNFFTTSNGFRSTLPVVNNLTAMNVWDGVCMCFIYASLLEFVAVNYVGRKRPSQNVTYRPGENSLIQQTDRKRDGAGELVTCTICGNAPCTHPANNGCSPEGRSRRIPTHPIRIAKTIDVVSRTVYPICFAAFLLFFFINYKGFHVHTED